ncbi:fibronectin type III domain-containing protein [uncultured Holdemanella sp.]|uniref:fibronectin type III domain-containing protein n=1 Tax=uncultured Holdemanella sp. TaxID=1763549 RepID=UPI002600F445|nr:fibronectin type III domain-containing protein [uncultured Holdemanella sp.]
MAYVGGGWALLGNHQIWSYSGRCNMYFQVYAWSEQDVVNNRSTVHTRTRVLVENKNPSYSGYRVEQDWSAGVTGAPNYSSHATLSDGGAGTNKEYILQNGSFTVDHDSNGNASSKVHYWFNGTYTGAIGSPYNTNVVDISLPKIDRTADKATISNVGSTYKTMYCTISVPFASEENQWSRDGKKWETWNKAIKADTPFVDTWTGLKPNTKYTGYYRFKRKYNGVWSKAVDFTTITKYPNSPSRGTVSSGSITSNSAKVSWSGFSLGDMATDYSYQTSNDGKIWTGQDKETSLTLSGLKANTKYTFYVRMVDNYGQPSLAASTSFTTLNTAKPNVGGIGCMGITPHGGSFSWYGFSVNEGATIDHYEYSLDDSNWINVGTDIGVILNDLNPETSYTLYVRIVDNFGSKSDSATFVFKTLIDQLKIAYNSNTYEENILTKDGVDILAKNGDNLIVDVLGKERLRTARVFYNDNGVIKKVKAVYFNKKGKILRHTNYGS